MEKQNLEENFISSNGIVLDSNDSVHRLSRKTSLLPSSGGVGISHGFRALEIDTTIAEVPVSAITTTSLGEEFALEIEQVMGRLKDTRDETRIQTMLVHTGEMSVRVKIADKAIFQEKLDDIVQEVGKGYYQQRYFHSESNHQDDARSESLDVTVRVLHEQFEQVIHGIKGIAASVDYVNTNSYDVAGDFVDAMARSSVLDALRSSLQTLMRKAQTVEEVLMLQREITRLIEEAESQRQRANSLQNQSKYSTLTLHIRFFTQSINSNFSSKWNPFVAVTSALHDAGILLITVVDGITYLFFWFLPFFSFACALDISATVLSASDPNSHQKTRQKVKVLYRILSLQG